MGEIWSLGGSSLLLPDLRLVALNQVRDLGFAEILARRDWLVVAVLESPELLSIEVLRHPSNLVFQGVEVGNLFVGCEGSVVLDGVSPLRPRSRRNRRGRHCRRRYTFWAVTLRPN